MTIIGMKIEKWKNAEKEVFLINIQVNGQAIHTIDETT